MRRNRALSGSISATLVLVVVAGCSLSEEGAELDADGGGGNTPGFWEDDASAEDAGPPKGSGPCSPACADEEVCSHGTCVPLLPCDTDSDCKNDTRCEAGVGCVPWSEGGYDDACIHVTPPGILQPKVKCDFTQAPAGDPFPDHLDVQGTPIVVNFNKPASSGPPSVVAAFTATVVNNYTEGLGIIRVLRGTDCAVEATLGGTDDGDGIEWIVSSASLAAGDLDGDGSAEIVAYGADGSTLAFTRKSGVWKRLWKAPLPAGAPWSACTQGGSRCSLGWAGPSIYDLDDDGKPEIVREGVVFDHEGKLKALAPADYTSYSSGNFSVVANLDQDKNVELTNGRYVWEFRNGGWVREHEPLATGPGYVAVADFGAYGDGVPAKNPEIVVVRNSQVAVFAIDGSAVMPTVAVPGNGGGPPTISDFDGDGLPEVAVAGRGYYTVYDIDCGPNPRPGGICNLGPCDSAGQSCTAGSYIAWSRATQDHSSNITGSSVFDFEADGVSEVVYGDECFTRVYNGETGEVIFSQYRSSCTWNENPIVADVDGNFRADLVVPNNRACNISCSMLDQHGVDRLFAGLRCKTGSDCASGVCDEGLCRCTASSECCAAGDDDACIEEGYKCVPPPDGTPGSGQTCRAAHPRRISGIRVYSDSNDMWVRSRTIWNQHAYAVTHVNEDGTIPKTSAWANNWDDPKLNNFRQNVPGDQHGQAIGDPTAGPSTRFSCTPSGVTLSAPLCNRGSAPIGAGLSVGFYVGADKVCATTTTEAVPPGECITVECGWSSPPLGSSNAVSVDVVVNDDKAYPECKPDNGYGTIFGVHCVRGPA